MRRRIEKRRVAGLLVVIVGPGRTYVSPSGEGVGAFTALTKEILLRKATSWPLGGMGLVAIAIALLAAPAQFEGPVLIPIRPGHAPSVLDCVALLPLLTGLTWMYWG